MKKIILVANALYTLTHFRAELIAELRKRGHKVYLVCPNEKGFLNVSPDEDMVHLEISRGGINPLRDFKTFKTLVKIFKKERPDIVINYTIKPIIYSSLAAAFFGPKTKIFSNITGLGYVFTDQSLKTTMIRKLVLLLYQIAFRFNECIFFQNPDDEALFRDLGILKDVRVKRINGSGINLEKIQFSERLKEKNSFIFVGRLLKDKGIVELVAAVTSLSHKYPQMRCYIIGESDFNPNSFTKEEINEFAKCPSLVFLGHRKDVLELLKKYEVLVLPSYREGTPRSNLEAMASGLPIITTDAPGCRETVVDGINGFLVPVKDSVTLAQKMEYFLMHPEMIAPMGIKSREYVEKKFDVREVNREVMETIGLV